VRAHYRAPSDVQWRADPLINSEGFASDCCAYHVDDGVFGADFVKVNVSKRAIVDLGFRRAEILKHSDRGSFCGCGDRRTMN
jgi:hypothetical protein